MLLPMVLAAAVNAECATAQTTWPGTQRIVHESWTFKDGAPQRATAFAQTNDGYLWLGSEAGLFRFDGVRFELFRSSVGDQLQSTNVSALLAADDGLWVGYLFGGFSLVKNGKVTNFVEATSTVTQFARDRQGVLWAGSSAGQGGLWRFDGAAWQRAGEEWSFPAKAVAQLGFDRDGVLWVLAGLRGNEFTKELHFLSSGERAFRKAADKLPVRTFVWDADKHVVTTHHRAKTGPGASIGLEISPPAFPILVELTDQIIDRASGVWRMTSPTVLRHAAEEPLAETVAKMSPDNSVVHAIDAQGYGRLVDREGSIWFAGESAVHRFSYSPVIQLELPTDPAPWFMVLPDDGGVVWVSAGDGGGDSALYRIEQGRIDARRAIAGVSSFAYRAPDKTFWFAGESGLWQMDSGALVQVDLPDATRNWARTLASMTSDGAAGYWVSFGPAGLFRLKDHAWTKYQAPGDLPPGIARTQCPGTGVVIAFTDILRRVWFGCTKSQLTLIDGDREKTFGPAQGLEVGNVTAIHGRASQIWIGGEFGLQRFDQGHFQRIRASDAESLRGISGIVETADGDLWLNGLGGIVHIRREEIAKALKDPAYEVTLERFDRRAGVPGLPSQLRRMPTAVEATDGRLWFTVNNGVVWLDPKRASATSPPPPVSIQSVAADDKGYPLDQPLRFPPGTSSVQFGYAATSLLHPESVRFRYKMDQVDREWQDAGESRRVSYRSLAPGSYRFDVMASDSNGNRSDSTAAVQFEILPAYYQTSWFRTACVALAIIAGWAVYRMRIRSMERRFEMTLDARVGERTRIARDLHDTLLQSFHGLLLRFQTASDLLPSRPVEAKQVLAGAIDQAAEAITEGRDAVQGLRASVTEVNDVANALRALGEELAAEFDHEGSLRVEVLGTPRPLHPIVRDEVFRIAGEAMRNAIRHADARQIEVELRYDESQLAIRVRDDGRGIDSQVLQGEGREGHFGLRGMRERAEVAGGKLAVWSRVDSGTEVELIVPSARAYASASAGRSWLARRAFRSWVARKGGRSPGASDS
jgi:signal transduction histidine kinase